MSRRPLYIVDSFTSEALAGNSAAVVLEAGGLQPRQMQRIAGELMQAETVFVSGAQDPAASFHLRWFTPSAEVRFCGHATLAALHVLAQEAQRIFVPPFGAPREKAVVRTAFSSAAGLLRVELWRDAQGALQVRFEAPPHVFSDHLVSDELLYALGLVPEVLDPRCTPRRAHGRTAADSNLFVCVREAEALSRLRVKASALAEQLEAAEAGGVIVFARNPEEPKGVDASLRAFFSDFLPGVAVEDPVTGSACGQLACLLQYLFPETMPRTLRFSQGDELGRPGRVVAEVRPEPIPGQIRAFLGGGARVLVRGELDLRGAL
jgi:trans-2,3-dihydro-3-hydroxyanthranilate isomerase